MRRAGIIMVVVASVLMLGAAPASAHTITGIFPTNYRSEILDVTPSPAGVHVELLDLGRRIRVTNTGTADLVVLGYAGEPYLRVGPRGVYENTHSPAVYLNRAPKASATTSTTLPKIADATATPSWHKRSSGHRVTWRDRRTRWEGPTPAPVKTNPHISHLVESWAIPATYGSKGSTVTVTGQIVWHPPPAARHWLSLILLIFVITMAIGLTRRWGLLMHVALAALIAINIVHSFVAAVPAHDALLILIVKVVGVGFIGSAGWAVGVLSFRSLDRNGDGGLFGAVISALLIAIYGGATDIPMLTHSQVLYAAPVVLARVAVSLTLGIGAGLLGAAAVVYATHPEVRPAIAAALERDRLRSAE